LEFAKKPDMVHHRLDDVVLQTKVLGHENAESFLMTAMDPPKTSTVTAAGEKSLLVFSFSIQQLISFWPSLL
jgi:hypothetical protein